MVKPKGWALELLKQDKIRTFSKEAVSALRKLLSKTRTGWSAGFHSDNRSGTHPPTPTHPHHPIKEKPKKEALFVTAENIESQNYRFTLEIVSQEVIELHMFKSECHYRDCKEQFYGDHGAFWAISPECRKI